MKMKERERKNKSPFLNTINSFGKPDFLTNDYSSRLKSELLVWTAKMRLTTEPTYDYHNSSLTNMARQLLSGCQGKVYIITGIEKEMSSNRRENTPLTTKLLLLDKT